jgi:hypothetical protein
VKKSLSIRELSVDREWAGTGEKVISGVTEGVAEVEYSLILLKT